MEIWYLLTNQQSLGYLIQIPLFVRCRDQELEQLEFAFITHEIVSPQKAYLLSYLDLRIA